jgi:hypothetical protein
MLFIFPYATGRFPKTLPHVSGFRSTCHVPATIHSLVHRQCCNTWSNTWGRNSYAGFCFQSVTLFLAVCSFQDFFYAHPPLPRHVKKRPYLMVPGRLLCRYSPVVGHGHGVSIASKSCISRYIHFKLGVLTHSFVCQNTGPRYG